MNQNWKKETFSWAVFTGLTVPCWAVARSRGSLPRLRASIPCLPALRPPTPRPAPFRYLIGSSYIPPSHSTTPRIPESRDPVGRGLLSSSPLLLLNPTVRTLVGGGHRVGEQRSRSVPFPPARPCWSLPLVARATQCHRSTPQRQASFLSSLLFIFLKKIRPFCLGLWAQLDSMPSMRRVAPTIRALLFFIGHEDAICDEIYLSSILVVVCRWLAVYLGGCLQVQVISCHTECTRHSLFSARTQDCQIGDHWTIDSFCQTALVSTVYATIRSNKWPQAMWGF